MIRRLIRQPPSATALNPNKHQLRGEEDWKRKTLDEPLVQLSPNAADCLTVRNTIEGVAIFGATGSGKTSGSGKALAKAFLAQGWGGLVLTAKKSDFDDWHDWASEAGRLEDIIELAPGRPHRFNFLGYEQCHPKTKHSSTHDVVSLFLSAIGGVTDRGATDSFWEDALRQMLTNAFDLVLLAKRPVTAEAMAAVVRTAPKRIEDLGSLSWQSSSDCWKRLLEADAAVTEGPRRTDFDETVAYWTQEFPSLAERTRSIVVSSFMSKIAGLLRSPVRELLDDAAPQATPDLTHQGKIIVINIPVKLYGETGRFTQRLIKIAWQRATERRDVDPTTKPVFLWADEAQYFITPEDGFFQQTARSSLAATVYLTQNLANYHTSIGGRTSEASTESLLGNLQTKIFHANGDPATNEWAARTIGNDFVRRQSQGVSGVGLAPGGSAGSSPNFSLTEQESLAPVVLPRVFTSLRKGGGPEGLTDAIVFQGGRVWAHTGQNYLPVSFSQD